MARYFEPFYGIEFKPPEDFDISQEYQGLVVVKRNDSENKPDKVALRFKSLYYFFVVQIIAELQKRQPRHRKGVNPDEVIHYLNEFNLKWPSIRTGKRLRTVGSLKDGWRKRIQKISKKNIEIRRQDNSPLNTERKRELLARLFISIIEQDKKRNGRKLFFKLNVNKPEAITFEQEIIPGLRPWKVDSHEDFDFHQVLSYRGNNPFWPLVSSSNALEMVESQKTSLQDRWFFRRTGPVAEDIESGRVYLRSEIADVTKALVDRDTVFILGDIASGKTAIARLVGYDWVKAGGECCFLELVTPGLDYSQVINSAERFGQRLSKPLLIVEDAHLEPNLINALLSQANGMNLKIVVTSRKPIPEISKKIVNYLKRAYAIDVYGADAEKGIISTFLGKTDWKLTDKVLEEVERKVVRISHGNLWLLSYALESLHVGKQFEIDRNSILDKVNKDLKALGEMNRIYPRILIALSVLYRYEILTDISFLYEKFSFVDKYVVEDALENLLRMGEIVREEASDGGNLLYGLPHSALADLYFVFAKKTVWEENAIYGDEYEYFRDYLLSDKAVNRLSIIKNIDVAFKKFRSAEKPFQISDRIKVINRIPELRLSEIMVFFIYLLLYDKEFCNELWSYVDKKRLSKKFLGQTNFEDFTSFIELAYDIEFEVGRQVLDMLGYEMLSKEIFKSHRFAAGVDLLIILGQKDPLSAKHFIQYQIDKGQFGKMFYLVDHYPSFSKWTNSLYNGNFDVWKEVWSYIAERGFLPWGRIDAEFFERFCQYLVDKKKAKQFWEKVQIEEIAERIPIYINSETGFNIVRLIHEGNPHVGKELCKKIDKERLAYRLAITREDMKVRQFIKDFIKIDQESGNELYRHLPYKEDKNYISNLEYSHESRILRDIARLSHPSVEGD